MCCPSPASRQWAIWTPKPHRRLVCQALQLPPWQPRGGTGSPGHVLIRTQGCHPNHCSPTRPAISKGKGGLQGHLAEPPYGSCAVAGHRLLEETSPPPSQLPLLAQKQPVHPWCSGRPHTHQPRVAAHYEASPPPWRTCLKTYFSYKTF